MEAPSNGVIYLISGDRGSGKTTVCARVARAVNEHGLRVAGILTERVPRRDDGADLEAGRRVVDLHSGEARPFGGRARAGGMVSDPLTPGWEFDPGVFAWANEVLSRSTPCDLLVVDEVGPLELLGGRGWAKALEVLESADYGAALVVCRPGLVGCLRERLDRLVCTLVEVTERSREMLPVTLTKELLGLAAGGRPRRSGAG